MAAPRSERNVPRVNEDDDVYNAATIVGPMTMAIAQMIDHAVSRLPPTSSGVVPVLVHDGETRIEHTALLEMRPTRPHPSAAIHVASEQEPQVWTRAVPPRARVRADEPVIAAAIAPAAPIPPSPVFVAPAPANAAPRAVPARAPDGPSTASIIALSVSIVMFVSVAIPLVYVLIFS